MSSPHHADVIVIGAGISGIAAARFYLDIHPDCQLIILEKDNCPGGTWNSERVYESFWTQTPLGAAEYSDMPMPRPPEGEIHYEFFKAKHLTRYLEDYIDQHQFGGRSLRDRITFGFEVQRINKSGKSWVISGKDAQGEVKTFHTSKLIVASGLTSAPIIPSLPEKEKFQGSVIHQRDFGRSAILSSLSVRHVTVLGGGKSAADMVYVSVKAGKSVSWLIRVPGSGPGYFVSPEGKGPYKNAYELGATRMAAAFTPSVFNWETWSSKVLHGTSVGRKILHSFWGAVDNQIRDAAHFDRSAKKGFSKLTPHTPIFWQNGTGGMIHQLDFWDTIAQNVEIYEDDILELDDRLVRLKSGDEIVTDVLLCGTGFTPSVGFFDHDLLRELGLPYPLGDSEGEDAAMWAALEKEADQHVVHHFPELAHPPAHFEKPAQTAPYRLYNGIAPLHEHSIVFIGHVLVSEYFRAVECQAIWATAYLDQRLVLPSLEDRKAQIALFVSWCRRRYLSNGERGNWMVFDLIGYVDRLLHEVGLSSHRQGGFRRLLAPAKARDLRDLRDEYVAKYGRVTMKASEGDGTSGMP